jgi:hypothetical protein
VKITCAIIIWALILLIVVAIFAIVLMIVIIVLTTNGSKICDHNQISLGEFQTACYNVMLKVNIKRNTLFFFGQSNAGKSVLMRSLRDGFCDSGSMTKSDTFAFQDCVDRQVIVNEDGPEWLIVENCN